MVPTLRQDPWPLRLDLRSPPGQTGWDAVADVPLPKVGTPEFGSQSRELLLQIRERCIRAVALEETERDQAVRIAQAMEPVAVAVEIGRSILHWGQDEHVACMAVRSLPGRRVPEPRR